MKLLITLSFVCITMLGIRTNSYGQRTVQNNGFVYSGEFFDDPDWGWSYRTTPSDRQKLARAHQKIDKSLIKINNKPGDYVASKYDMSYAFDSAKQAESSMQGSKCPTCYYSQSPSFGHFQYQYTVRLELLEGSKTYLNKVRVADSLYKAVTAISADNSKRNNSQDKSKEVQKQMEAYQKEIEQMDMSNLTEAQLREIERRGAEISRLADAAEDGMTISDDSMHAMYGSEHSSKIEVRVSTNDPLLLAEKNRIQKLRNSPGFYYRELNITGCDFACIYFDLYNKSELPFSKNPVFIAYIGPIRESRSQLPKQWLDPFCVRVSFAGNLEQIHSLYPKINFTELRSVTNH